MKKAVSLVLALICTLVPVEAANGTQLPNLSAVLSENNRVVTVTFEASVPTGGELRFYASWADYDQNRPVLIDRLSSSTALEKVKLPASAQGEMVVAYFLGDQAIVIETTGYTPGSADNNPLPIDFSALTIYDTASGAPYLLGENPARVTILVLGRVTCGLTLRGVSFSQDALEKNSIQDGQIFLLDLDNPQQTVQKYGAQHPDIRTAWSSQDSDYNKLFWTIYRQCFGQTNSAQLPVICVLDQALNPVYYTAGTQVELEALTQALAPYAPQPADSSDRTAYEALQTITIDGTPVTLQAYARKDANGNGTNYVKLRDVALLLNGTKAQFQVDWDGAVNLTTGRAYTRDGTEMNTPFTGDRACEPATATTRVNGQPVQLSAILLKDDKGNGYTYYKLRDLGAALGFAVNWSPERGVSIETGASGG